MDQQAQIGLNFKQLPENSKPNENQNIKENNLSSNITCINSTCPDQNQSINNLALSSKSSFISFELSKKIEFETFDLYYSLTQDNKLGQGGVGEIYNGLKVNRVNEQYDLIKNPWDSQNKLEKEIVIIKRIDIEALVKDKSDQDKDTLIKSLKNEVSIPQKLNNNHIIKIYQAFQADNNVFIVMEKGDCSLKNLLEHQKMEPYQIKNPLEKQYKFDQHAKEDYLRQIVDAFYYLQVESGLDIVHRDVSPSNILLKKQLVNNQMKDVIKLIDFQLSNNADTHGETINREKCQYICPEASYEEREYMWEHYKQYDIWSLGIVFWEMFTQTIPWIDDNQINKKSFSKFIFNRQTKYLKLTGQDHNLNPENSIQLKHLVRHMLNREPEYRYTIIDIKKHPYILMKLDFSEELARRDAQIIIDQLILRSLIVAQFMEEIYQQLDQISQEQIKCNYNYYDQIVSVQQLKDICLWGMHELLFNIQPEQIQKYLKDKVIDDIDIEHFNRKINLYDEIKQKIVNAFNQFMVLHQKELPQKQYSKEIIQNIFRQFQKYNIDILVKQQHENMTKYKNASLLEKVCRFNCYFMLFMKFLIIEDEASKLQQFYKGYTLLEQKEKGKLIVDQKKKEKIVQKIDYVNLGLQEFTYNTINENFIPDQYV